MKINGRDYNFGRCLRVTFVKNGKTLYKVEHCPELSRDMYVAMDVTVTDMPSATEKDKPGFQGSVTIYNPSKDLLDIIIGGATWLSDYVKNTEDLEGVKGIKSMTQAVGNNAMKRYYASRISAQIDAGYFVDGKPNYRTILAGYVNGSSFSHRGVDDVLTIGIFDIDMTQASIDSVSNYANSTQADYIEASHKNDFAPTWHETFVKYVQNFETDRLLDNAGKQTFDYLVSSKSEQAVTPLALNQNEQFNYITQTPVRVSDFDRSNKSWFNIYYAKSPSAWKAALLTQTREDTSVNSKVIDKELRDTLTNLKMPQDGGISGIRIGEVLDGLCAVYGGIHWVKITENVGKVTYLIYRLGNERTFVDGEKAAIKIWNYQNLLESPSVDGSGKMTVKMVFNPNCVCLVHLALMLTKEFKKVIGKDKKGNLIYQTTQETDVTRNVDSFESSQTQAGMIGSMVSQTSNASFGVTQINGTSALAMLNKAVSDRNKKGYMFNIGMPIIRVEHKLSTYGKDWTTTVKTVPTISGMNYGV